MSVDNLEMSVDGVAKAGRGNRTLVFSLEGYCSTIELHPRLWMPRQTPDRSRPRPRGGRDETGECRIRTCEGISHQIYSLTPLTARETPLWCTADSSSCFLALVLGTTGEDSCSVRPLRTGTAAAIVGFFTAALDRLCRASAVKLS